MEPVFPLTVELETGDKHFASEADLEQWLDKLSDEYSWLPEQLDIADQLRNFLENKTIAQIRAHVRQAVANEEAGTATAQPLGAFNDLLAPLTAAGVSPPQLLPFGVGAAGVLQET